MADLLRMPAAPDPVLSARGISVSSRERQLLRDVDLTIPEGGVFGIIGPSGAGKSTLLKVFNRLLELETPPLTVTGDVRFRNRSIYADAVDADHLRSRVGMLFQQPVVFPASIRRNVLFGVRHVEKLSRSRLEERLEEALRAVALWGDVRDRLSEPAVELSVGQQQRLCLARTLALRPEVVLMDEPTSALDPRATDAIEERIAALAGRHTIVLVTHDLAQARRTSDFVACLCRRDDVGQIIETGCCTELFDNPRCPETIDYLDSRGSDR